MTLRIHVLPETPREGPLWACAEIRLIGPLTHPSVAERVTTTYSVDATLPSGRLDVVSIQRSGVPGFKLSDAVSLVKAIRDRGAKIVYDIDDDLLCPHPIMAIEAALARDRQITRFLAREADLITCSTDQMAIRMAPFPAPKKVWRNAIDERLLPHKHLRAAHKDQVRALVGYAGTATHFRDLLSVTESLRRALSDRAGTVGLDFFGAADQTDLRSLFGSLLSSDPKQAMGYKAYFQTMQSSIRWNVAMAPLLPNDFNKSKSDIKFLEYSVFGFPGVYSKSHAYNLVKHNETGIIAEPETYGDAVAGLLDSPDLRHTLRQGAYDYVMTSRTLDRRAGDLVDLVESVM